MSEFKVFQTVSTIYGNGFIKEIRNSDYIVILVNWNLAQGQSPTLYLQKEAMKIIPGAFPGTTVDTVYGHSKVESIREDGTHICRPINWSLAYGQIPTLYLQQDSIKLSMTEGILLNKYCFNIILYFIIIIHLYTSFSIFFSIFLFLF
jgi:hypothetical protein